VVALTTPEGRVMKARISGVLLTTVLVAAVMVVGPTSAGASAKPLDVDRDVLAATNECVNAALDEAGVEFDNLGDLVFSATTDDAVFDALDALYLLCSGGTIDFESASQLQSTNAKFGLTPQVIENIRD
jgi:hypothetical protein